MPPEDCEVIIEWIKHKNVKNKDWLIVIALQCDSVNEFDTKRVYKRLMALKQSLFKTNSDFIDVAKREKSVVKLLVCTDQNIAPTTGSFGELVSTH